MEVVCLGQSLPWRGGREANVVNNLAQASDVGERCLQGEQLRPLCSAFVETPSLLQ